MGARRVVVVSVLAAALFFGSLGCESDRYQVSCDAARKYVALMLSWRGAHEKLAGCEAGIKDRLLHADARVIRDTLLALPSDAGEALARCILSSGDMAAFTRDCHWVVASENMAAFGHGVRSTYLGRMVLRGVDLTALEAEIRQESVEPLGN